MHIPGGYLAAVTTVVMTLGFLSLSCGGDGMGESEKTRAAISKQAPVVGKDSAQHVIRPTAEPTPDTEPLDQKVERLIEQTKDTKSQYGSFRERLFAEALDQASTILCAIYRLEILNGKDEDFYKRDPEMYIESVKVLLKRLGSQPFIRMPEWPSSSGKQPSFTIIIPSSEPYAKKSLAIVELEYRIAFSVNAKSVDNLLGLEMVVDKSVWYFDPSHSCDQSYREPVTNSTLARRESSKRMAILIATSLHSLRSYPTKLEITEREWARANDLELLLNRIKKNLEFIEADPTTRQSLRGYEEELKKANEYLNRAKSAGRLDINVNSREVREILDIFQ